MTRRVLLLTVLVLAVATALRFQSLGARSLWVDEFATWHVSRMPLGESLNWQPELTKPPLYQLSLRFLTSDPRPTEWVLRLPAALAGVAAVGACMWLGTILGGPAIGIALGALLACNGAQIDYSQEARSYSMLVFGAIVSTALFFRLSNEPRRRYLVAYVVTATLTLHVHYLFVLTALGHFGWWLFNIRTKPQRSVHPLLALIVAAGLSAPMAIHFLRASSSVTQGLSWIDPPSWSSSLEVLSAVSVGHLWVLFLLLPALFVWALAVLWPSRTRPAWLSRLVPVKLRSVHTLLVCWFLSAGFGLILVSWLGQPAVITRYALPAAIPAMLFPLTIVRHVHRRALFAVVVSFLVWTVPDWTARVGTAQPGFRELVRYLQTQTTPSDGEVVLVIDNTTYPDWEEMERLPFRYYPLDDRPIHEIQLLPDGSPKDARILHDSRACYLVVFRSDPFKLAELAGRRIVPLQVNEQQVSQLLFSPYRLAKMAPSYIR